ncbi:MAG: hypothetical protein HFACDABA_00159 [Anaerolineales bacterium]|nr:hypothetical protein [Anaerolineales bacterium]
MEDWFGYVILGFVFCVMPLFILIGAAMVIRNATKTAQGKSALAAARPTGPKAGAAASKGASPVHAAGSAPSDYTPLYLNFSNKPRAILDNMSMLMAQAGKVNATRASWVKGPRFLFWAGLGLMLVEGLIYLLGYTPSCAFVAGGIALWVIGIVLSVKLKRAQVQAFPPAFGEFEKIINTLRDDLRPGSGFLGNLDLTGAKQTAKVAREAKDARGRTTQYFRDQWLNFKAKMYDGNVLRVSGIQRVKERKGYWGVGQISGKSKWKPAKFKGAYQELKVRIAVNSEMYTIASNQEIKTNDQVGDYTINAVDTSGDIVTVLASSPRETVSAESVLGVLKSAYGLLQLKKA